MNQKCTTWTALAASVFAGGALATNTQGQTSDTLLNALIKKGIITEQEAKDIKAEANKDSQTQINQTFAAKTGMSSWINSYKLYGDFRARFEENNAENSFYQARDRYRFRLRLGLNVSMFDGLDIGLRLSSGNPQSGGLNNSNPGGSAITANQDLNSVNTRKFIWIDAAYGRLTPVKNDTLTISATLGKMDNPFQLSNMVWDYDINPEGGALQATYNLNDQHALKAIGAAFVLDEFNQQPNPPVTSPTDPRSKEHVGHDPYMYGGQILFESKWTPKIDTSLGVAAFNIVNRNSLSDLLQPRANIGNSRDINGFLKYYMNPIIGSGSVTYKLATFPGYTGQFPIKVAGEYMDNPPAPTKQNRGWRAGVTFGKAGRKNTWELNYRYQRLEADAWYDALVDDDNGAFYTAGNPQTFGTFASPPAAGFVPGGWFGGTNIKGHQVVATYSFTDSLNLTFIYYLNEAIINAPGVPGIDTKSDASHFMADLNFKF